RAARMYRVLGTQPGPTFTPALAASLGGDHDDTEALLDTLLESHLVEDAGDRLRFHDLLRVHARQTARRVDPPELREATIMQTIQFYLMCAQRMDEAIVPDRLRFAPGPATDVPGPAFSSPADALGWFEAERPNLLAAVRAAHERELHRETW